MKLFTKLLVLLLVFSACKNDEKSSDTNPTDIHKVIAQEVLHVREYSYIRVLENGQEKWIAAPITTIEIGSTYYIGKTMEMQNFESKDLNKTFETVYFVEKISSTAEGAKLPLTTNPHPVNPEATKPTIEKKEVKIEASEGTISLSELFKNKDNYNNKIVTLQGEVTKFNPAIMNLNWIHMQDGTEFNEVFDLTVTTKAEVKVGDKISIKGKVTLNKDFGAGYFYKIIVENAEIIN